jgi:xylulokinase
MDAPHVDPLLRAHTFCHVVPEMWYMMGVVLSAGGAFNWYREQFARDLDDATAARQLDDEAGSVPAGAGGVTFLPYLQGERTPHRDASIRGALLGLSLAHTRAHATRAVLEGIAFALRDSLTILHERGLAPANVLLTGGGAKSAFLRSLQADVFGLPVTVVNREEGPAYGAALLGAVGIGAFTDLGAATRATLSREPLQKSNADLRDAYERAYGRYRASYQAAHVSVKPEQH